MLLCDCMLDLTLFVDACALINVQRHAMAVQADALEHALMAALPLGPQSAAGGVSLPDSFAGELQVRSAPHSCSQPGYAYAQYLQVLVLHKEHLVSRQKCGCPKGTLSGAAWFNL